MATSGLFNNPILSDIKLVQVYEGEKKEYHAHRAVLASQSQYSKDAFTENSMEATAREMTFHDDDPDFYEIMLKFVYTAKYDQKALVQLVDKRREDRNRGSADTVVSPIDVMMEILAGLSIVSDKYHFNRIQEPIGQHFMEVSKCPWKFTGRHVSKGL